MIEKRSISGTAWPVIITLVCAVYFTAILVNIPENFPRFISTFSNAVTNAVFRLVDNTVGALWKPAGYNEVRHAAYLLILAVIIPWLAMICLRRGSFFNLGLRKPNRIGVRAIVVGFCLSIPAVIWVALGEEFAPCYLAMARRAGYPVLISYFLINLFSEHFFCHGFLLAILRPGMRWPDPPPVVADGKTAVVRFLQWCGLAQLVGDSGTVGKITRWLGLPDRCLLAIGGSTVAFFLLHLGKDPRELAVSVLNGILLAYVAYRTNSWLVPFIVHGLAAVASFLVILIMN